MAEEQSTYSRACLDIDTNLWCLSPDARDNIKAWFERISQEAYDRGKRDGSEISADRTIRMTRETKTTLDNPMTLIACVV
jgi:hypothetical protein